jgi:hypothetical protein
VIVTFKEAVDATPDLKNAYCRGLQALKNVDKQHVTAEDTKTLAGSVDVDSALQERYPQDNRWDYAIGHTDGVVYWIEVHGASDGELKVVLAKLKWLKTWLRGQAKTIGAMPREFVWVSSGKTSFTLASPQQKQFALEGLQHKGRIFKVPKKPAV